VTQSNGVIHISKQQIDKAMAMMGRAFRDDPLLQFAIPDFVKRVRVTPHLYGGIIRYCLLFGKVYTTPKVDGAACWLPPNQPSPI
jgi:hypothetical protein